MSGTDDEALSWEDDDTTLDAGRSGIDPVKSADSVEVLPAGFTAVGKGAASVGDARSSTQPEKNGETARQDDAIPAVGNAALIA